jgi:hypothetical protein
MIDGITSGANGWAVATNDGLSAVAANALFTLTTPLAAGSYQLVFTIDQNYGSVTGGDHHTLGDFSLGYTTGTSPTLVSSNTPVQILSGSSTDALTTFTLLSPGELLAGGDSPVNAVYTIVANVTAASPITGIFLDTFSGNVSLPGPAHGPGRQPINGNFVVTEFLLNATPAGTAPEPGTMAITALAAGMLFLLWRRAARNQKRDMPACVRPD